MATAVPNISAMLVIQEIPPHSRNWPRVSMSAVTRETNAPRFSAVWSAMLSSWMWAKVRTRSAASAFSLAITSRRWGPAGGAFGHRLLEALPHGGTLLPRSIGPGHPVSGLLVGLHAAPRSYAWTMAR